MSKPLMLGLFLAACIALHVFAKVTAPNPEVAPEAFPQAPSSLGAPPHGLQLRPPQQLQLQPGSPHGDAGDGTDDSDDDNDESEAP